MRRRFWPASPIQRARKPASRRSSAASTCSIRRRCSASASRSGVGVVEEDVDPDARVRAGDAGHVAQRAAGVRERLVPVDRRRAGLVDDHVREHVRQRGSSARRAGRGPAASIATGVAPSSATKPCTSRCRSGSVSAVGVRNQVAPSNRPALACSAPRVSEPQIGCPPTNRARAAGGGDDARLRRADVGDGGRGRRSPRAPPRPGRAAAAIGAATTHELGAGDRLRERRGRASTAPRSTAAASASGSGSQPRDVDARAPRGERHRGADQPGADDREPQLASCSDGPRCISSARRNARSSDCRRVQARVAERLVAGVELLLEHVLGAAEALRHVLAGELEVDAAGPGALLASRRRRSPRSRA